MDKRYKDLNKSRKTQMKAQRKLVKARDERIWIEDNPHIHILNYPFYKFKKWLKK